MNYYYEIDPNYEGHVFGEKWLYWCMPNCSPAEGGHMNFKVHDDMVAHSHRVWLENVNGITLIKEFGRTVHEKTPSNILTWLKLQAVILN